MTRGDPGGAEHRYVAVVGPGETATSADLASAREVGQSLAESGCVVVTGGLGGVMAAAVEGATAVGGLLAVGGSWGTLSEVSLAVRTGVPVVQVGGWDLSAFGPVPTHPDAASAVEDLLGRIG